MDNKKSLINSFILNFLVLCVLSMVFKAQFEMNDDTTMSFLLNGAYFSRTPFVIHSNVLLGFLICGLSTFIPFINWFAVVQLVCIFCSLWVITYFILHTYSRWGYVLAVGLSFIIGIDFYISMTYTKTAALVAGMGCLVLVYAIYNKQKKWFYIAFPMIIIGLLLRDKAAYLNILYGLALGACAVIFSNWYDIKNIKKWWKEKKVWFISLASLALLCVAFTVIQNLAYARAMPEVLTYNSAREKAVDYTPAPYEGIYADQYQNAGITPHDLTMIANHCYNDLSYFDTDFYTTVKEIKPNRDIFAVIRDFTGLYKKYLLSEPIYLGCLLVGFLLLFKGWSGIFQALVCFGVFHLQWVYMLYIQRLVHRVIGSSAAVLLCALVFCFCCGKRTAEKAPNIFKMAFITLSILFVTFSFITGIKANKEHLRPIQAATADYNTDFLFEVSNNKDTLYILDGNVNYLAYYGTHSIYSNLPRKTLTNIAQFRSWNIILPQMQQTLNNYGVKSLYRDIANENICIVGIDNRETLNWLVEHMKEHYKIEITFIEHGEIAGETLYKIIESK